MLGVAIVMGYVYQGPPFRLACPLAYHACIDNILFRTSLHRYVSPSAACWSEHHCICRWSYKGLGEPLCFVAFGPLATCAFYLAQV